MNLHYHFTIGQPRMITIHFINQLDGGTESAKVAISESLYSSKQIMPDRNWYCIQDLHFFTSQFLIVHGVSVRNGDGEGKIKLVKGKPSHIEGQATLLGIL